MNISQYENRGFVGTDIDLKTSLMEYGLIWKEFKRAVPKYPCVKGEYLFIGHGVDSEGKDLHYSGWIDPKNNPVEKEFEWVEWDEFLKYSGQTMKEFKSMDFGYQVESLVSYYGLENILGSPLY